ncbi:hypothetical protein [Nocardia wallacei]|uniref:hypothetical protein n=1 Tax=Nocardia wallacei TaxID=480035 RepID=UPI002455B08C|nr:hypothetical protein [Nocardia wallacei]
MYWAFDNPKSRDAGAYPPEPLNLTYGHDSDGGKRLRGTELQRAYTATGRPVQPSDCGPIRVISAFGNVIRSPGRIIIERAEQSNRWRDFQDDHSTYGPVRVSGDRWHGTESGFVASWLAGSEYAKISTGILVFFPKGHLLYQGPLPNRQLIKDEAAPGELEVMAGLEYFTPERSREINGQTYGMAAMNVIARVPPPGKTVDIPRGRTLGWFYLVAPTTAQHIETLPATEVSST